MSDAGEILVACPKCGEKTRCNVEQWTRGVPCPNCRARIQRPRKQGSKGRGAAHRRPGAGRTTAPPVARPVRTARPVATPASPASSGTAPKTAEPVQRAEPVPGSTAPTGTSLAPVIATAGQEHTTTLTDIINQAEVSTPKPAMVTAARENMNAQREAHGKEISSLVTKNAVLQQRLDDIDSEKQYAVTHGDSEPHLGILEAENEVLKEKFNVLIRERVELTSEISRLNVQVEELRKQNDALAKAVIPPEKMTEIHERMDAYKSQLRTAKEKLTRLQERLQQGKRELEKVAGVRGKLEAAVQKLRAELDEERARTARESEKGRLAEKNADRLATELHELKQRVKDMGGEKEALTAAKAALEKKAKMLLAEREKLKQAAVPPEKMTEIRDHLRQLAVENKVGKEKFSKLVAQYKRQAADREVKAKTIEELGEKHKKLSDTLAVSKQALEEYRGKVATAEKAAAQQREDMEAKVRELETARAELQRQHEDLRRTMLPPEKIEELKERITKLTVETKVAEEKNAKLNRELEGLRTHYDTEIRDLTDKLKHSPSTTDADAEQEMQVKVWSDKLAQLVRELDRTKKELDELRRAGAAGATPGGMPAASEEALRRLQRENAQLREKVGTLFMRLEDARDAAPTAAAEPPGGDAKTDELRRRNEALEQRLAELDKQAAAGAAAVEELRQLRQRQADDDALRADNDRLTRDLRQRQADNEALQAEIDRLRGELAAQSVAPTAAGAPELEAVQMENKILREKVVSLMAEAKKARTTAAQSTSGKKAGKPRAGKRPGRT